ncbi:MAG: hypothetical protein ACXADY_26185 [Candidatus Hodarchaeales archaeon]
MKKRTKRFIFVLLLIGTYYFAGYLYYTFFLPYSVMEGDFALNLLNQELEIEYHDPDISYRDLLVKIRLVEGANIEIIYIQCSDEAKLTIEEGKTATLKHNFAGAILIRLVDPSTSANGSYKIIDWASFFVPKSATKACTSMPGIAFFFSITAILLIIIIAISAAYFAIFRRDIWKQG